MDFFLPFDYPSDLKIKLKKMKIKNPGNIILHMCTKNYDHMMYGCSWDMVCNGQTSKQTKKATYIGGHPTSNHIWKVVILKHPIPKLRAVVDKWNLCSKAVYGSPGCHVNTLYTFNLGYISTSKCLLVRLNFRDQWDYHLVSSNPFQTRVPII